MKHADELEAKFSVGGTPARVAARYIEALTIGEPKVLLEEFQEAVAKFRTRESAMKGLQGQLLKCDDAHQRGDKEEYDRIYTGLDTIRGVAVEIKYGFPAIVPRGRRLFLSILQQYALPPKLLKPVQAAAKFWSKSTVAVRPDKRNWMPSFTAYVEAYLKLLDEFHRQISVAEQALEQGKLHSDPDSQTKLPAGPFTVVNTGNFPLEVIEKVVDVVKKAADLMREAGFGKVCYGDILVSNTIGVSGFLAFYMPRSDEMFVRANIPVTSETVRYVCHELAHRLEHQFLKGKEARIKSLYDTVKGQDFTAQFTRSTDWPEPGDTVEHEGKKLTVIRVDAKNKNVVYHKEGDPPNSRYATHVQYWIQDFKGIPPHEQKDFKGFVTGYAKKSPGENFAEMISYFAIGKLPDEQKELLYKVLD